MQVSAARITLYLFSGSARGWLEEGGVVRADGRLIWKRRRASGNAFSLTYILIGNRTVQRSLVSNTFTINLYTSAGIWLSIFRHFSWSHWQFSPHVIFPLRHLHCLLMQRPLQAHWRGERLVWPQPSRNGTDDANGDRSSLWDFTGVMADPSDTEEPALQLSHGSQYNPAVSSSHLPTGGRSRSTKKADKSCCLFILPVYDHKMDQLTPNAFVFFDTLRPFSGFSGRHSSSSSSLSFSLGEISSSMLMVAICGA